MERQPPLYPKRVVDTVERFDRLRLQQQEREQRRLQATKSEVQKVRDALAVLEKDVNFQIIFRYLAKISGQFKSSIVVNRNTSEVSANSTIVNAARRSVYLDMRRFLSAEARQIIESKGEEYAEETELDPEQ